MKRIIMKTLFYISPKKLYNKGFAPFLNSDRIDKYNGTWMGLAIYKKIVENHSGLITATSRLGKDSTFDIYHPMI